MLTADASSSVASTEAVPILDLHFHPQDGWDLRRLVELFDQLGVAKAGNGAIVVGPSAPSALDNLASQYAQQYPDRFIPFAGQTAIRRFIRDEGDRAWKLESQAVRDYLDQLQTALAAGRFKGIGELFVNNVNSRPPGTPASRYPTDSPLMRRLWNLSAAYGVPLSVHMEASQESVAEMERLLASDRKGTWIWAHAGNFAQPDLLRRLLQTHSNLFCELAQRDFRTRPYDNKIVDDTLRLLPAWKELLEEFPERFVLGTDVAEPSLALYSEMIGFWRRILNQLPLRPAVKIAHQNAERLLNFLTTYRFPITYEGKSFIVVIRSASTISDISFSQPLKQISFNAASRPISGSGEIVLPRTLLGGPYTILVDGQAASTAVWENATHAILTLTYPSGLHHIRVVGTTVIPEFPVTPVVIFVLLLAVLALLLRSVTHGGPRSIPPRANSVSEQL